MNVKRFFSTKVGVLVDGGSGDYFNAALARNAMPFLRSALQKRRCERFEALGCMPSFTNTNNASIVTRAPPAAHGIAGNYTLHPKSNEPIILGDPKMLLAKTSIIKIKK